MKISVWLRSTWSIIKVTEDVVYLVDHANETGRMSVTNDAEDVVHKVLADHPGRRIVYKDTEGRWDELRHNGKHFTGFASWKGLLP